MFRRNIKSNSTPKAANTFTTFLNANSGCEIGKEIGNERLGIGVEAIGHLMVAGIRPELGDDERAIALERATLSRAISDKLENCEGCSGDVYGSKTVEVSKCPLMKSVLQSALSGGNYFTDEAAISSAAQE